MLTYDLIKKLARELKEHVFHAGIMFMIGSIISFFVAAGYILLRFINVWNRIQTSLKRMD